MISLSEIYNQLILESPNRVTDFPHEKTFKYVTCDIDRKNSDCQLWAFAKLLDVPYSRAYDILSAEGWNEKNPNRIALRWENALTKMGMQLKKIYGKWDNTQKGFTLLNVANVLPNKGKFVIAIKDHVLCMIDGVVYDSDYSNPYSRVEIVYQII